MNQTRICPYHVYIELIIRSVRPQNFRGFRPNMSYGSSFKIELHALYNLFPKYIVC